ncbi:hypothetical protein HOY82DRAFT_542341 [Tuber indicum]|nr:hypothetical protein HOY82DRAFT_542341 [Tuber indicum]
MALALPLSYNPHTSHLPALLTILPLQQPFLRSRHRCLPPQFTAQTNLKPKRFSGPLALAESIDTVAKVSILTWDTVDLSSTDLGGQVLGFSDEWFDAADNLINPAPPVCKPGVFVPTSVWYYGLLHGNHAPPNLNHQRDGESARAKERRNGARAAHWPQSYSPLPQEALLTLAHNHDPQRFRNKRSQTEQEKASLAQEQAAQQTEKQILANLEACVADLGSEISEVGTHTMNCTVMISEARIKAGYLEYADSRREILGSVKTMVSGFPIGGGVVERIGAVIGELELRSLAAAH